ncbi:MAG: Two-component sensor PilS [Candidatus Krumholzibacteriota bacterium]|nr:Two-component sensor PilS [Candidatus Krumholzibacteriota bacterium]
MGLFSRVSAPSAKSITTFLTLRAIFLTLTVGAGIMIVQLTQVQFAVGPLYVLLLLGYAAGGVLQLCIRFGVSPVPALWALMIADVLLETGILHYSGGINSQFSLVYGLSIIASAVLLQMHGGLGIALFASLCYTGYGVIETEGVLRPAAASVAAADAGMFIRAYMHVSLFFIVGALSGYLADRVKQRGSQLDTARSKLKQLRLDTERILEHMSSGVLVVDSAGKILGINPTAEQILGVDKSDVVGIRIDAAFDPLMPEFAGEIAGALESGQGRLRHELTLRRPDGSNLPLGMSTSILKDDAGEGRGVIAVFKDLTEVHQMEERMRKADRLAAIGELSAGIAHEIRNPLASISGSIEILYNELELSGDDKHLMELIMKESDRLNKIINDFLEFARLRPPRRRPVEMGKCVDEVAALLANNPAARNGIDIRVVHADGELTVESDEEQMKQVVVNLAINACEAMTRGGKLAIETRRTPDGQAKITVRDEGPGIGLEARARLFEPFFTTKEGGTGLGLAIANKIVESHGGTIETRNREEGGAEFSVVIPLRRARDKDRVAEPAGAAGSR